MKCYRTSGGNPLKRKSIHNEVEVGQVPEEEAQAEPLNLDLPLALELPDL